MRVITMTPENIPEISDLIMVEEESLLTFYLDSQLKDREVSVAFLEDDPVGWWSLSDGVRMTHSKLRKR